MFETLARGLSPMNESFPEKEEEEVLLPLPLFA
jgi:hypothetical protein